MGKNGYEDVGLYCHHPYNKNPGVVSQTSVTLVLWGAEAGEWLEIASCYLATSLMRDPASWEQGREHSQHPSLAYTHTHTRLCIHHTHALHIQKFN